MQIKVLAKLTIAEIRRLARSAANRDDALDIANVFPIGTDLHAVFTTEYLSQFSALNEPCQILEFSCAADCRSDQHGSDSGILTSAGTGIPGQ